MFILLDSEHNFTIKYMEEFYACFYDIVGLSQAYFYAKSLVKNTVLNFDIVSMGKYINTLPFMNLCLPIISIKLTEQDPGFLTSTETFSLPVFPSPSWDNNSS